MAADTTGGRPLFVALERSRHSWDSDPLKYFCPRHSSSSRVCGTIASLQDALFS